MCCCGEDSTTDITITKRVVDKAMRAEKRDSDGKMTGITGHGLSEGEIVQAIMNLDSPTMVFKGKTDKTILVITEVSDNKGRNIVIAIEFDRKESFSEVNSIRSVYGRDNLLWFIGKNIDDRKLLVIKKQKADELLRSIGKSYPKENTFISLE